MNKNKLLSLIFLLLTFCFSIFVHASQVPAKPFPPFRIAGNLYFVGDSYAAAYLIVTSQGNILVNSNNQADVPKIKASIEKLGFNIKDTKILLISHAHFDHSGGSALIKQETGANYMVMAQEVAAVESGGKTDFQYGNDPATYYQPTKVDTVLHDGEQIKLGNTVLTAHLTPGHTKGCTTWTMRMNDKGKSYNVVIVGGPYVLSEYKLVHNKTYPAIAGDYRHMWRVLKSLPCDIFLGAHGSYFDLEKKYARMQKEHLNTFIDPEGYKKFIAQKERDFYIALQKNVDADRLSPHDSI